MSDFQEKLEERFECEFLNDTGSPKLAWILQRLDSKGVPYRVERRDILAPLVTVHRENLWLANAVLMEAVIWRGQVLTIKFVDEHHPYFEEDEARQKRAMFTKPGPAYVIRIDPA